MLADNPAGTIVVIVQEVTPTVIAELQSKIGRPNDISKENGSEYALQINSLAGALSSDEFFDVSGNSLNVSRPERVIARRIFNVFRSRDTGGELAA